MAKRENKLIDCLATKPEGKSHIAVHADVITEPLTNERLKKIDSFFFFFFCFASVIDKTFQLPPPFFFFCHGAPNKSVARKPNKMGAEFYQTDLHAHTHTQTTNLTCLTNVRFTVKQILVFLLFSENAKADLHLRRNSSWEKEKKQIRFLCVCVCLFLRRYLYLY